MGIEILNVGCNSPVSFAARWLFFCAVISALLSVLPCRASSILNWNSDTQGSYVTATCVDGKAQLWVGTDGNGIWRFDPAEGKSGVWHHFTAASTEGGLGDDCCYAIAVDFDGRVWAGTGMHGVAVFDGQQWRTYGLVTGPLGVHVTAIAISPISHDIWMAAECGLSRYSDATSQWTYYTRANGLSSDAINALSFDKNGDLYVATQCNGLNIGHAIDDYSSWTVVTGPETIPNQPAGSGLPSDMLSSAIVTKTGTVLVGTISGIAASYDKGRSWTYMRGNDWRERSAGYSLIEPKEAVVSGIELIPNPANPNSNESPIAIACGNPSAPALFADRFFEGGAATQFPSAVDLSQTVDNAPLYVYQHGRQGSDFSYSISGLPADTSYKLRLHFNESECDHEGQRVFSVDCNGTPLFSHFDIYAASHDLTGTAIIEDLSVKSSSEGVVRLHFHGDAEPKVSFDPNALLSEDRVTCLSELADGTVWVGHWRTGLDRIDPKTLQIIPSSDITHTPYYVDCLISLGDQLIEGRYGGGVTDYSSQPLGAETFNSSRPQNAGVASAPKVAEAPGLAKLESIVSYLSTVKAVNVARDEHYATVVDDDWRTEGDWIGRYGKYWACLCAMSSPYNITWGAAPQHVIYDIFQGPDASSDDSVRYWIQWLYTSDPRVLEIPPIYFDSRLKKGFTTPDQNRREAETDDHGEEYPVNVAGPDLYCTVVVPSGLYYLSLYDVNYNSREWDGNRFRDYRVTIRQHPTNRPIQDVSNFSKMREMAHARIQNFAEGVWKRFLVNGPVELTIKIDRNNSFNTMLPAATLDLVDERPSPYYSKNTDSREASLQDARPASPSGTSNGLFACREIVAQLDSLRLADPRWWVVNKDRYYINVLRHYLHQTNGKLSSLDRRNIATCYYELGMYSSCEDCYRDMGVPTVRDIEKSFEWKGPPDVRTDCQAVLDYLSKLPSSVNR
jgi:hypothetical protein